MFYEFCLVDTVTAVLCIIIVFVIYALIHYDRHDKKLPPGPTGLPLVGYLPFMTRKPHEKLYELTKKYGPVYSLKFGSHLLVMVCDSSSIKEAFSQDAFMGRPPNSQFQINRETKELGAFNHLPWKDQRRFSLHLLKDLGFGKSKMEGHIREEINELLEMFEKECGRPFFPSKFLAPSVSNNISSLVFGKRRKFDDPKRIMLDGILKDVGRLVGSVTWQTYFPLLRAIIRFLHLSKEAELSAAFQRMKAYIRAELKEHQESLDPNDIRDFIDGYLLEIERSKNDPKSTFKVPVLEDLVGLFFGAGSGTVRNALDWLLLVSAAFPEVQKKVQSEIDEVLGRERFPSWSDRERMPYTEAVILEVLRWRASLPINLPRYTIEDTHLRSFFIPQNTQVVAVFWALHHDPLLWGKDVGNFKPERFLSENGKETRKPEYFLPFSSGKRSCPGETLARIEIFMYYAAILQKFRLRLPDGAEPNFEGILGLGLMTKPYNVCMELRI